MYGGPNCEKTACAISPVVSWFSRLNEAARGIRRPASCKISRARILLSDNCEPRAREPAYATPARSRTRCTVPSSPTPPCNPFITTSICASAREESTGIPRECQTPFLSTRISRASYFSSGSAESIAAPVFSERLYSRDVPPRKTPTIVRDIAQLYHSLLHIGEFMFTINHFQIGACVCDIFAVKKYCLFFAVSGKHILDD